MAFKQVIPGKVLVERNLLREVRSDGHEYAVKLGFSRAWFKALQSFTSTWNNAKRQWGFYYPSASHDKLGSFWRIQGIPLERTLQELYFALVRAGEEEGIRPSESLDEWVNRFAMAKADPERSLFTDGLRVELLQLEDFSVMLRSRFHAGIISMIKSHPGFLYRHEVSGWQLPFISTRRICDILIEEIGLAPEQVLCRPGIYRFDEEEGVLEELTQEERKDWEVTFARRGNVFDDIAIPDEISLVEEEGAVETDLDLADSAVKHRRKFFLDVAERMKSLHVDDCGLDEFVDAAEKRLIKGMPKFKRLLDAQRIGIRFLVGKSSSLLADDMGLGKTITSVIAARYRAQLSQKKVVVVATKSSLRHAWFNTIRAAFPDDRVSVRAWKDDAHWIVLNYESLQRVEGHESECEVVIFDEAHRACCPVSMRTSRAFSVAHDIPNRYLVTGTPILNSPLDLHTLLRLSGHAIGEIPVRAYLGLMENDDFRAQVHGILRSEWLLRRMKTDVLSLKPKKRRFEAVKMSRAERAEFLNLLRRGAGRGQASMQLHDVRAFLARVKARAFMKWLINKVHRDDKVIVFCEYEDSVQYIESLLADAGFGFVTIYGKTSDEMRNKAQDSFQTNPDVKVFIGTTRAAGESITLTAANIVYFVTLPWTHGAFVQAEDRAWRNGQERVVRVVVPLVEESIDSRQWDIIEAKGEMAADLFTATPEDEKANMDAIMEIVLKEAA